MKRAPAFPIAERDERTLDRRRLLRAGCAAAVAVVAGDWIGRRSTEHEAPSGDTIAVPLADGTVVVWDRRCPHLGCPVLWAPERQRLECPCHRAAFDARTGEVLFGPPQRGLRRVRVERA